MTRSTHIASPEPATVRALLTQCGWSAYDAARRIGVSASIMQRAASGAVDARTGQPYRMHGSTWALLLLHASQAARAELPAAPLSNFPTNGID